MTKLNVNPTRMELTKLKKRLKTAEKGHKMLKDKSDEMIRQFMSLVGENIKLREEVEREYVDALNGFILARATSDGATTEEAFIMPEPSCELTFGSRNVMSVSVPKIEVKSKERSSAYPYGFIEITDELDNAVAKMQALEVKFVKLAEIEKTCNLLADEIEKNRRRVNALEYVMIPDTQETIKYISMKLDENERANIIRLMKVKNKIDK